MSRPLPSTETTLATGISIAMVLWIAVGVVPIGAATSAATGGPAATVGATPPPGVTTPGNETDTADASAPSQQALVSDLQALLDEDSQSQGSALVAAADRALVSRQRMAADGRLPASLQSGLATERTNLQGAQALMDIINSESAEDSSSTLTRAVRLTEMGMKVQVAQRQTDTQTIDPVDVTLPAVQTPDHASPSDALFALHDRHGVTPSAQQAADIRALDELSEPTRSALTDVLNAYLAYERTGGEAGANVAQVRAAQLQLLEESVDLRAAVGDSDTPGLATPASHDETHPQVASVVSIDLTTKDNTYTKDYALLIDRGGNDNYSNNAGGAATGAAGIIDLNGSDEYLGRNGGAKTGAGFLLDVGDAPADDDYIAGGDGTLHYGANGGGANGGVGFLLDVRTGTVPGQPISGGGDTYEAGGNGTNGGGWGDPLNLKAPSAGFHLDVGTSTDTYDAGAKGTNGGGHTSLGFLLNTGGDDTYDGIGIRNSRNNSQGSNGGGFEAGKGFLLDTSGSDTYEGGRGGGNGGGYSFGGVGFLYDVQGGDTYTTYSAGDGVNGGGKFGGVGLLVDTGTATDTDTYTAGSNGVNGGANKFAAGFLVDGAGDETYDAKNYGVNGGASAEAAGFLLNAGGQDSYTGGGSGVNGGAAFDAVGMLLDVDTSSGKDEYISDYCSGSSSGSPLKDDTIIPKGTAGAQVDNDSATNTNKYGCN